MHSQLKLCFSTVLSEESSFSEIAPSGSCLQLGFSSRRVHAPPEAWQKMYSHLGEHLLGCLHLTTSVTPKISMLLQKQGTLFPEIPLLYLSRVNALKRKSHEYDAVDERWISEFTDLRPRKYSEEIVQILLHFSRSHFLGDCYSNGCCENSTSGRWSLFKQVQRDPWLYLAELPERGLKSKWYLK